MKRSGQSAFESATSAIYRGDVHELAKFLRNTEQLANQTDEEGRTLLMIAVLSELGSLEIAEKLLTSGLPLNARDTGQRWTALHFAARDQKTELVRMILDAGAEIDPTDAFGNTPLWRCIMGAKNNLSTARELVTRGANPCAKNQHGVSPFDLARTIGYQPLVTLLSSPTQPGATA